MNAQSVIKASALVVVTLLMFFTPGRAVANSLDVTWGTLGNLKIVGQEPLNEDDVLKPGDYWCVEYDIKVKKWLWEGEDVVKQRVMDHLKKILGKVKIEHPEIWIFYAEYRFVDKSGSPLCEEYLYRAKIVGKVMTQQELEAKLGDKAKTVKLAAWVPVAIIIGLILACIISTIVLVNQPAVQKLITAASNTVQKSSWAMPVFLIGLGAFLVSIPVIVLMGRKE